MSAEYDHVTKLRLASLEARVSALEAASGNGPSPSLGRMLTTKEAAPILGVSETTLKRLINMGKIKAKRESNGSGARSISRISEAELRRYMESDDDDDER